MLEKPKRPKKFNNLDRQLPRNIQELVNRYDLENLDIYEFLDYLVEYSNNKNNETAKSIENIETKIEEKEWTKLELTEDFKPYQDNEANTPKVRKIGRLVEVMGVVSPAKEDNKLNSYTGTRICTLPEGVRPLDTITSPNQGSETNIWTLSIYANGSMHAGRYRNGSEYADTPPGTTTWLPFHEVFLVD